MHWSCCQIADFSGESLQQLYAQLSPSRKEYIHRLRRTEDRTRSLAAELLVYRLLQEHYTITGAQLHRKSTGQPYLTGCDLYVSISHCDDRVACVLSRNPVGIDIERIHPITPSLCRRVCVDAELAYLQIQQEEDYRDPAVMHRFFEIWTAKEAYFKKHGTGITDLKSVNILPLQRHIHTFGDYILQIL